VSVRLSHRMGEAALVAVVTGLVAVLGGCRPAGPEAAPATTAAPARASVPGSAAELAPLIVSGVPSGLPRLPDAALDPPAGAKGLDDVAAYSTDAPSQREVLRADGYRFGWERFWGVASGPMTGVFVDEFTRSDGAARYAADLAGNEQRRFGGQLTLDPPRLPTGCRVLTVAAGSSAQLHGPAAFVWCPHGVFSVSVIAVAGSAPAADREMRAVLERQLALLPG
jgi:hypothetical protein